MKKTMYIAAAALLAGTLISGCSMLSGSGSSSDYEQYKKTITENPPAYVATGDQAIDSLGKTSATTYATTIKYLDEYIKATDGNKNYVAFQNDVESNVKGGMSEKDAANKVLSDIQAMDAKQTDVTKKQYDSIVSTLKAANDLKPENKLKELGSLGVQVADTSSSANKLSKSFSGFDPSTMNKVSAIKKIISQTDYTADAIKFLQRQYEMVQDANDYSEALKK